MGACRWRPWRLGQPVRYGLTVLLVLGCGRGDDGHVRPLPDRFRRVSVTGVRWPPGIPAG